MGNPLDRPGTTPARHVTRIRGPVTRSLKNVTRHTRAGTTALVSLGLVAAGAAMAVAEVTTPNTDTMKAVGPVSSYHGFPVWYEDSKGLRLEQCLDLEDPFCDPAFLRGEMANPDGAISFPDNWPMESFYYSAGSIMDMPGGGSAGLVSAVEATFANEATIDGDQVVFGRLRFDIDFPGAGTYRVTHPYGVDTFEVSAAEADGFRYVEDITPAPGNFALALKSRINPFLVSEGGLVTGPDGSQYIGDPAQETRVTGSAHNTNYFSVEQVLVAEDGTTTTAELARTEFFSLMGKVSTNSGVAAHKAVLSEVGDPRCLDVFASTDAGKSLTVNDDMDDAGTDGITKTILKSDGERYFARIPLTGTAPTTVTVTNESDVPVASKTLPVTDDVVISSAVYDTTNGQLTVSATSTDQVDPSTLTVDGRAGDPAATLTDGTATIAMAAPPASVTVTSTGGGSDTAPVTVTGGGLATPAPTTAVATGPTEVLTGTMGVELDGSASQNAASYQWAQTGGAAQVTITGANAAKATFDAPAAPDELTFTLTTTGADGTSVTSAPLVIKVVEEFSPTPDPEPEVLAADATADPMTAMVGQQVTVSGTGGTTGETYSWSQVENGAPIVAISDASAASFTFSMPQTTVPLRFELTVTGAEGVTTADGQPTSTDAVEVSQMADQLTVGQAQYRADKREWRVSGTASITSNNTVKVYVVDTSNGTEVHLGDAIVGTPVAPATTGDWGLRVRGGITAPPTATLTIRSTKGGLLEDVIIQRR